jgi:hypothetical protein
LIGATFIASNGLFVTDGMASMRLAQGDKSNRWRYMVAPSQMYERDNYRCLNLDICEKVCKRGPVHIAIRSRALNIRPWQAEFHDVKIRKIEPLERRRRNLKKRRDTLSAERFAYLLIRLRTPTKDIYCQPKWPRVL